MSIEIARELYRTLTRMARRGGLDRDQATVVERQVPAYNRLKTDCVASRSVWLRTRMAGGVGAGRVNAPGYPIMPGMLIN